MRTRLFCSGLVSVALWAPPAGASNTDQERQLGAPVAERELETLRGGLRVGRFDVDVTLSFIDRVNGRDLDADVLSHVEAPPLVQLGTAATDDGLGAPATRIRRVLAQDGFRVSIENAANDVRVQSDTQLSIRVRNFKRVLGDPRGRPIRAFAARIARGGPQR